MNDTMLNDDRILTLHPSGKKGVNILQTKYETIKVFILDTIQAEQTITYEELNDRAVDALSATFEGKVPWYVVTVKLDLEARGIIERIPKTSPHQLRLVQGN